MALSCNDIDPILLRLKTQSCNNHPLIFINMYKWSTDDRGKKLLTAVKRLKNDGCKIKVMGGFMRPAIGKALKNANIPYIDTGREEPETISHAKMVTFGGNNPEVCTGSAHFNGGSLTGSRGQVLCIKTKNAYDVITAWNRKESGKKTVNSTSLLSDAGIRPQRV